MLIDTAYETKRIRSVLEENMRERMSLESQRREDIIAYNRELREKATAQKAKASLVKKSTPSHPWHCWDMICMVTGRFHLLM